MKTKILVEQIDDKIMVSFSGPLDKRDVSRLASLSEALEQLSSEIEKGTAKEVEATCLEIERVFNSDDDQSTQLSFEGWPQ